VDQSVERRNENRLPADTPVVFSRLDSEVDAERSGAFAGNIVDIAGGGLMMRAAAPAPCGCAVRIESADTLFLGEVCRCEEAGGEWRIAVQIRHRLDHLGELQRLNRALLGKRAESRPVPARIR
jgi:hypothetical protein